MGAPKAGTTSLAAWLADHPEMAMSGTKELEFLDRHFARGVDWYLSQLPQAPETVRIGEATPGYLAHPLAAERARMCLPETRFVAVLREPVDRAWSQYQFLRMLGVEHRSWKRALAQSEAGKGPADYLGDGRYVHHLARWDSAVGSDRLLVVLFDDFRAEPARIFQEICRFAGIRSDLVPQSTAALNPTRRPRNHALQVFLHTTGLARRPGGRALHAWNIEGSRPASIDPQLADDLKRRYVQDWGRLEQRLQRPLPAGWYPSSSL